MPITTGWYDDDHRVITQQLDGNWTWDELNGELEKMAALATSTCSSSKQLRKVKSG